MGLQYSCSSDIDNIFENNLTFDMCDPRMLFLKSSDTTISVSSNSIERLSFGESTGVQNQLYVSAQIAKFYKYDRTNYINMSALIQVTVDSVGNLIYPTSFQEMTGYPITLSVDFPAGEKSLVRWSQSAAYARKSGQKTISIEVRGVFNDFDGYFTKDKPEPVYIDEAKSVSIK